MRLILNVLCALYWTALFVLFIIGKFTPDSFTIGASFLLTSLAFASNALEAK